MVKMVKKQTNRQKYKFRFSGKCLQYKQATFWVHSLFLFLLFLFPSQVPAENGFIELNNMPPPKLSILFPENDVTSGTQISIQVIIPPKWHVNANIAADEFLKPSSLEISAKGVHFEEPVWPTPFKEYSEALDLENLVFKDTFEIIVPIKSFDNTYDITTLSVTFHYQACSNSICLAPASVSASLTKGVSEPPVSKKKSESFLLLLTFAFLGGLLLNLMPCVLPVLSLKLFGFIQQAGQSRKRLISLGLSVTAGILCSLWTLALIVSLARTNGDSAGWGLQFQSIHFIALMVVILSIFAASLFGAFDIWLPGQVLTKMDDAGKKKGYAGAFFTGVLLVLLSTPCSAPFLGAAMGFAFTASTPVLFLFFSAAALGLSFPYLIVCIFPKALSLLPKPGPWMVSFKKVLGLFMLGTAVWLIWIAYGVSGLTGIFFLSLLSLISILGGVVLGRFAPPSKPFSREVICITSIVILLFGTWQMVARPFINQALTEKREALEEMSQDADGWLRYSPDLMRALAQEKQTIFLNITADWCLTCKANEAMVLSRDTIKKALENPGIVKVKADWTQKDDVIRMLMESLNRSGVPVYAVYPGGDLYKPEILSEILTVDAVLKALKH